MHKTSGIMKSERAQGKIEKALIWRKKLPCNEQLLCHIAQLSRWITYTHLPIARLTSFYNKRLRARGARITSLIEACFLEVLYGALRTDSNFSYRSIVSKGEMSGHQRDEPSHAFVEFVRVRLPAVFSPFPEAIILYVSESRGIKW